MLEHGGYVSKYARGGGIGAGLDCAWVRGSSGHAGPSYFNIGVKDNVLSAAAAAFRFRASADASVSGVVPGWRKLVGPATGGERQAATVSSSRRSSSVSSNSSSITWMRRQRYCRCSYDHHAVRIFDAPTPGVRGFGQHGRVCDGGRYETRSPLVGVQYIPALR